MTFRMTQEPTRASTSQLGDRRSRGQQTRREAEDSRACGSRLHLCMRFDWFPSYPYEQPSQIQDCYLAQNCALLPCLQTPVFAFLTISPIHLISLAGIAFRRRPTKSYQSDSVKGWAKLLAAKNCQTRQCERRIVAPLSHSFSMWFCGPFGLRAH